LTNRKIRQKIDFFGNQYLLFNNSIVQVSHNKDGRRVESISETFLTPAQHQILVTDRLSFIYQIGGKTLSRIVP
jgi:hypothetical protein